MTNSPRSIYLDLEVTKGGKPQSQAASPPVLRLIPPVEAMPFARPTTSLMVATIATRTSGIAPAVATQQLAHAGSSDHDLGILAALDLPAATGESTEGLHRRREHALGTLFAAFTSSEALALHKRLSIPTGNDPVSARFARMVADRRARLMAFLAGAQRREAIESARRPFTSTPRPTKGSRS